MNKTQNPSFKLKNKVSSISRYKRERERERERERTAIV
jgi:hypothetical protein